jgi:RHS repeat-associated protein
VTNAVVWRWDLTTTAFGDHIPANDPDGNSIAYSFNLRYPGQYYDGLEYVYYNYFRDYDSRTGRYLQSDPIGLRGGPSTYGYVGGSPLRYIDPFGLNYWEGSIVGGQWGWSKWGLGATAQGFSLSLEMPIGKCDFYGKRYRVQLKSSKKFVWGDRQTFLGSANVTFDDGNQAFEPDALVGSFSLNIPRGSTTGTIRIGKYNKVMHVTVPIAPQKDDIRMDGTLSYQTSSALGMVSTGIDERKCGCDQPADPGFTPNGARREQDEY